MSFMMASICPETISARSIEELLDAQGVLQGDAGYRRNGITAQFGYRLDIRLHTQSRRCCCRKRVIVNIGNISLEL